jgi:hypothetical protein
VSLVTLDDVGLNHSTAATWQWCESKEHAVRFVLDFILHHFPRETSEEVGAQPMVERGDS